MSYWLPSPRQENLRFRRGPFGIERQKRVVPQSTVFHFDRDRARPDAASHVDEACPVDRAVIEDQIVPGSSLGEARPTR